MKALINPKICDNAPECSGIAVCPIKAMTFDETLNQVVVSDECTSCGLCEKACPVGAIMVAKSDTQYLQYQNDIENDPRTIKDLFVDRYGAAPLSEYFMIEEGNLEGKLQGNSDYTFIELYNDDSIQCLIKSIPIKDITDNLKENILYYRLESSAEISKKYNITELPSLLIFKKDELLGKVEGYYSIDEQLDFENQIKGIMVK